MEIQDDTAALRQLFDGVAPDPADIESVHQAELEPETALLLMANPKAALQAMNVPVSEESVVNVSMRNRAQRNQPLPSATGAARVRRIIIIVIHYRNCDSDVIIIGVVQ